MVIPTKHKDLLTRARFSIVSNLNLDDGFISALQVAGLFKPTARRIRETKENKDSITATEAIIEELDNGRLSLSAFCTCLDATKQHALLENISQEASKVGLSKSDLLDQELLQKLKRDQDLQKFPSHDTGVFQRMKRFLGLQKLPPGKIKPKPLPSSKIKTIVNNLHQPLLRHLKFDEKLYLSLLAVDFPRHIIEQIQTIEEKEGRQKGAEKLAKELENGRLTPKQLYTSLDYSGQTHLVKKMEEEACKIGLSLEEIWGCASPGSIRMALKIFYLENFDRVPYLPWIQSDTLHLSQVYVSLEVERQFREGTKMKRQKLSQYTDIFHGIGGTPNPCFILVFGEPGTGKTVFSKKFGFDWANGDETLQKFHLVFVLFLRDWKTDETFEEMICRVILKGKFKSKELKEEIERQGEKILVIIDGLDEAQSHIDVTQLRESFKNNKLVVTTRPIGKDTMDTADVITFIQGFEPEGGAKYIRNFFKNDTEYNKCKEEIEKKDLLGMSKIPLLLHLLCLLYRENKELPPTVTGVYLELEELVLKLFKSKEQLKDKHFNELMKTLYDLAYKGTIKDELIFGVEAMENRRKLFALGFVSSWKIPGNIYGLCKLTFIHKTFQDYYTAKCIVNDQAAQNEFLEHCDTENKILALKILFIFCCGINGKTGVDILHEIQKKQLLSMESLLGIPELISFQMQGLCEVQDVNIDISSLQCYNNLCVDDNMYLPTVKEFSPKTIQLRAVHIHELTPTSLRVSIKKETSKQKSCQLSLNQLEEIKIEFCTVDKAAFWDEKLSESTSPSKLHTLRLIRCKLSSGFLSALFSSPHLHHLKTLHLSGTTLSSDDVRALFSSPHLHHLKELSLSGTTLSSDDVRTLFSSPHLHHLTKLDLIDTTLGGKVSEAADVLHHHHQQQHLSLEELWMVGCHLTEGDIPGVVRLVELSPHMKYLGLDDNPDAGGEKLLPLLTLLEGRQDEMWVRVHVSDEELEEWRRKLPQHKINLW